MFRFHLVKDHPFTVDWCKGRAHSMKPYLMTRKFTLSPVEIRSTDNPQLSAQLKELMEMENGARSSGNAGQEIKLNWTLKVEIGVFPNSPNTPDFIRVWGTKEGNVLTRLKDVMDSYGLETTVRIEINEFRYPSVILMTRDVGILDLSAEMHHPNVTKLSGAWDKTLWDHTKPQTRSDVNGVITITCSTFRKNCGGLFDALSDPDTSIKVKPYVVHKMLKEGLDSDATIIASDGEEIKCHRIILKGHSDVFEAMFKETSKSVESTTGIIQMKDMCSKSIHAFLAFLYLEDLGDAKGDAAVALDLLKAAHKYNVPRLEEQMKRIFLGKPNNWFDVEVALQLFIFMRKIDGGDTMKKRATAALKSNRSNLDDSPSYNQLFSEDPDTSKELCGYLMSIDNNLEKPVAGGSEAKSKKRKMDS